ncbi:zinc finger HIT domain-containing protein 2 [Hyla sarda]|uniref:zinc finger HIT domain-containing protein 2 n=1 Tax=Hyla sarda TaxID=327740 RepID=UPI0024C26A27|nr:zinc finger HIT domain-containing protein 2 [Hyla sarda]
MAAPEGEIVCPGRTSSPTPAVTTPKENGGPVVCALCLSAPGKYTCPRCNAPYCSLACYRGARHTACSELFYKEAVLRCLREEDTGGWGRKQMEETLLKLRKKEEDPLCGTDAVFDEEEEENPLCGTNAVFDEESGLWGSLSSQEKQHFSLLLQSGHIGSLIPVWTPWWETHQQGHKIMELPEAVPTCGHHETPSERGENDLQLVTSPEKTGRKEEETLGGERSLHDKSPVSAPPPLLGSIPPLSSLTRCPSPLVRFTLVNVIYGYAFSLLRHNGDLSDPDIMADFIGTLLSVSGALSTTAVYNSTAHALKSAVRAASDPLLGGDEGGAILAMEATAKILLGDGGNKYSLAAISHLYHLLGKIRKLVKAEKDTRKGAFTARKKCLFLASWVNEHEEGLAVLSAEVMVEYTEYLKDLNEVAEISKGLQRVWAGKRPPAKKKLIQEVE